MRGTRGSAKKQLTAEVETDRQRAEDRVTPFVSPNLLASLCRSDDVVLCCVSSWLRLLAFLGGAQVNEWALFASRGGSPAPRRRRSCWAEMTPSISAPSPPTQFLWTVEETLEQPPILKFLSAQECGRFAALSGLSLMPGGLSSFDSRSRFDGNRGCRYVRF